MLFKSISVFSYYDNTITVIEISSITFFTQTYTSYQIWQEMQGQLTVKTYEGQSNHL